MARSRTLAVTGVDGFVGRHLAAMAAEDGWRVVGVAQAPEPPPELSRLLSEYHPADLRHDWPLRGGVDAVIHLAGLAAVGPSFAEPQTYIESNSSIVTTMCEALLEQGRGTRVVGVSSGAVYAAPDSSDPVDEESPTAESSPYVVSKLLVEHQLAYYTRRGLDTVVVRPFNHVGPGQRPGFLVPDLALALRDLEPGRPVRAGDLTTERDYTDVRDVARAYLILAGARGLQSRVYNVASGSTLSGQRILELLAEAFGRPVPAVEVDPSRVRATDPKRIIGQAGRLRREFGWQPEISIPRSIADFIGDLA